MSKGRKEKEARIGLLKKLYQVHFEKIVHL